MGTSGWWKKPANVPSPAQPPAPATTEVRAQPEPQTDSQATATAEVRAGTYADPPPARPAAPAAAAERSMGGGSDASIGDQVNQALGEFEARLARLKEQLEGKLSESKEIESEIVRVEKEQAKAFKGLLKANPEIRKILAAKTKGRPKRRRPSRRKAAPETETEALR